MLETYNLSKKYGVSFRSDPVEFWLEKISNMPFNMTSSMHIDFNNNKSVFETLDKKDFLQHTPYHNFNHILSFLSEASIDPDVRKISITIYRFPSNNLPTNRGLQWNFKLLSRN